MTSPKIVIGGERDSDENGNDGDDDVVPLQIH
jgi:hypothetical protein